MYFNKKNFWATEGFLQNITKLHSSSFKYIPQVSIITEYVFCISLKHIGSNHRAESDLIKQLIQFVCLEEVSNIPTSFLMKCLCNKFLRIFSERHSVLLSCSNATWCPYIRVSMSVCHHHHLSLLLFALAKIFSSTA